MFVIIVNQILKMLLLLLLGCLCFRMRLIDENGSKVLANPAAHGRQSDARYRIFADRVFRPSRTGAARRLSARFSDSIS